MDTFSNLLMQLLNASDMKTKDLFRILEERGSGISYPALGAYKNFNSVPPFDRAKMILDALNYDISDEDLTSILQFSRDELKRFREDDQSVLQQGIRLSPAYYDKDIDALALREIIERRAIEVLPDAGNFNSYVNKLIKDDLLQAGYLREGKSDL